MVAAGLGAVSAAGSGGAQGSPLWHSCAHWHGCLPSRPDRLPSRLAPAREREGGPHSSSAARSPQRTPCLAAR